MKKVGADGWERSPGTRGRRGWRLWQNWSQEKEGARKCKEPRSHSEDWGLTWEGAYGPDSPVVATVDTGPTRRRP